MQSQISEILKISEIFAEFYAISQNMNVTILEAVKNLLESLRSIYPVGEAASIALIVMEDAFGLKKPTDLNLPFEPEKAAPLEEIQRRLLEHEPVQYVLGHADFYGMKLKVNPAVLIPRQETEELVAWVLETIHSGRVLDVGTGSGCIPISIKKKRPALEVHSLDVSAAALEVARGNATANGVEVHFHEVNILKKSAWKTLPEFDLIVSNPPYITEKERRILPKNVVDYEPHLALFSGGNDAQRFVKKIADFALLHLRPGGWLFFETNEFYAPVTLKLLKKKGFTEAELRQDLNERDRMIRVRKPD